LPLPEAGFSFSGLCRNELFSFTDTSSIKSGSITGWNWNFTDDTSTTQNPTHLYGINGTQDVTLIVTSDFGCKDTLTQSIEILQPPIAILNYLGECKNEGTQFFDASIDGDGNIISWKWNFGDGSAIDTNQNPIHTFDTAGTYNIILVVESDLGCKDTSQTIPFTVNPSPVADFTVSDEIVYINKIIDFFDQSSGPPNSWYWNFDDSVTVNMTQPETSIDQNPSHSWLEVGVKHVLLVVSNSFGCTDSIMKKLIVKLDAAIPTGFSPDGNGQNDVLFVRGGSYIQFDLKIFNEWGELIFQTSDPTKGWDGTKTGIPVPIGVYVYSFVAVRDDHKMFNEHGNVTLIR